jgi:hypothetical protein
MLRVEWITAEFMWCRMTNGKHGSWAGAKRRKTTKNSANKSITWRDLFRSVISLTSYWCWTCSCSCVWQPWCRIVDCFIVQEAVLVAREGGVKPCTSLYESLWREEQDNELANADVLERIQSQSYLESDTHYVKITNLLLEAWNRIGPNKMFLADLIMAAIFV